MVAVLVAPVPFADADTNVVDVQLVCRSVYIYLVLTASVIPSLSLFSTGASLTHVIASVCDNTAVIPRPPYNTALPGLGFLVCVCVCVCVYVYGCPTYARVPEAHT